MRIKEEILKALKRTRRRSKGVDQCPRLTKVGPNLPNFQILPMSLLILINVEFGQFQSYKRRL